MYFKISFFFPLTWVIYSGSKENRRNKDRQGVESKNRDRKGRVLYVGGGEGGVKIRKTKLSVRVAFVGFFVYVSVINFFLGGGCIRGGGGGGRKKDNKIKLDNAGLNVVTGYRSEKK